MNAVVVDQDVLHLEIRLLAILLVLEFDESILQRVASLLVSDHLARQDLSKTAEDQVEVLVWRVRQMGFSGKG